HPPPRAPQPRPRARLWLILLIKAKENIQEMKKELDSLLQTAEKAFTVELLKMPIAIRKMKRKDLLRGVYALRKIFIFFVCLLVKVTTIVEYEDAKHISAKKISKKVSKTKSLVSLASGLNSKLNPLPRSAHSSLSVSEAVKALASDCSATNYKAMPKVSKSARLQPGVPRTVPTSRRVQGMLLRSKSVPQDKTLPFVNIPLADGQTLCTAAGDLHNIDVQLLNQDTVQHIHNLVVSLKLVIYISIHKRLYRD
uniref:Borealin-2 n=1 Tax=Apteryx owenii TaxID=8824 RepID=A0A8B9NV77_APTOW